jgi:ankyrin repeat protein
VTARTQPLEQVLEQTNYTPCPELELDSNVLAIANPPIMWCQTLPFISFSIGDLPFLTTEREHSYSHSFSRGTRFSTPPSIVEIRSPIQRWQNNDSMLKAVIQSVMCPMLKGSQYSLDRLKAIIPDELIPFDFDHPSTSNIIASFNLDTLTRVGLYLFSNGLLPKTKLNASVFLQWIQSRNTFDLLHHLHSINHSSTSALVERAFEFALLDENVDFIRKFSKHPLFKPPRILKTSLKEVYGNQNVELIEALIDAGVDVYPLSMSDIFYKIQQNRIKIARESGTHPGRICIERRLIQVLLERMDYPCHEDSRDGPYPASLIGWAILFGDVLLTEFLLEPKRGIRKCSTCRDSAVISLRGKSQESKRIVQLLHECGIQIPLARAIVLRNINLVKQCLVNGQEFSVSDWAEVILRQDAEFDIEVSVLYIEHVRFNTESSAHEGQVHVSPQIISHDSKRITTLPLQEQSRDEKIAFLIDWIHVLPHYKKQHLEMFLQVAVNDDSECLISSLIEAGVGIGRNTIKIAVKEKSKSLVLKLLNSLRHTGCNISPEIVVAAASRGDADIFKALTNLGISMNFELQTQSDGSTKTIMSPLSTAILKERHELVSFMLDHGVKLNYTLEEGRTSPLEAAIVSGNPILVKKLLELGANPQDDGALYSAVLSGHEMVDIVFPSLFQAFPNRNSNIGVPALQISIEKKNSYAIQLLLANGILVNELPPQMPIRTNYGIVMNNWFSNRTAVETAIIHDKSKSLDILKQIMEALKDWNAPLFRKSGARASPLLLAIKHKNPAAVDLILERGADMDVNECGVRFGSKTPLTAAIKNADFALVQRLIELGANVHAPATLRGRMTPLQCAAAGGLIPIARLLLSLGVDVDAPRGLCYGRTALEAAANNCRIDMIHFLVKAGALITGKGKYQFERAKELATEQGHDSACKLLDTLHAEITSPIFLNPCGSNSAPMEQSRVLESQGDQAVNDSFGEVDLDPWINMEMAEGAMLNAYDFDDIIV